MSAFEGKADIGVSGPKETSVVSFAWFNDVLAFGRRHED
jgi:hypothetical protein